MTWEENHWFLIGAFLIGAVLIAILALFIGLNHVQDKSEGYEE